MDSSENSVFFFKFDVCNNDGITNFICNKILKSYLITKSKFIKGGKLLGI